MTKRLSNFNLLGLRTFAGRVKRHYLNRYGSMSWSQEGEDILLRKVLYELGYRDHHFYVDVGAHHPWKLSNTYYFYRRGWRGINIDAMPGSMDLFRSSRPRDINIEAAVAEVQTDLTFYIYKEAPCNTCSPELVEERRSKGESEPIREVKVKSRTLRSIFEENKVTEPICFMSIDVEGLDLQVLRSNDFQVYRPHLILIETEPGPLEEACQSPAAIYLKKESYSAFAKTQRTMFFIDNKRKVKS